MKRKMQSPSVGNTKQRQLLRGDFARDLVCDGCWEELFSTQIYKDLCLGGNTMHWVSYSVTVSEIQRSATAGCTRCSWCTFLCDIARFRRRCLSDTVEVKISQVYHHLLSQLSLPRGRQSPHQWVLSVDGTELIITVVPDKSDTVSSLPEKKGTILGQIGNSFEFIKNCIDECSCARSHQNPTSEQLPTRLIDLQPEASSNGATIIPADRSHTPYVTLSYCWGMQQRSETTASNVVARMQGLDESKVPQTIRDAFVITRQLGYRYIWVDALCIVQNSPEDKLKELRRMTSIYEHAALTIFAASAHHADEGILRQYSALPSAAGVPFWITDGGATSVEFQAIAELKQRQDEPGFRRAWTCQEQMLSERVLTYTSSGVEYRCTAGKRDVDELGHLTLWTGYTSDILLSVSLATHTCFNMKTWLRLMTIYTSGETTYDEDRLFALAGIAEKFQGLSRAPYVAGIFVNNFLPHQLLWMAHNEEEDHFVQDHTTYIAPSWSWASHQSCIAYYDNATPFDTFKYCRYEAALKYSDLPFGPVTSARLHVKGQLRKVMGCVSTDEEKYSWFNQVKFDDDTGVYACIDRRQSLYRRTEWFCLPVLWVEAYDGVRINGLVISPMRETGIFRRVGHFSSGSADSFDNLDQQDIILV